MKKKKANPHSVVIIFNGDRIHPPDGYEYGGKRKNRFLPEYSSHFWMNGYAHWRPSNKAIVYVR